MAITTASAGSLDVEGHRPPDTLSSTPTKRVLLVSNRVMHYRVSVYNYFWKHFRDHGWDFSVLTNELQKQNRNQPLFELIEKPFDFFGYRREIRRVNPDAVILFLHMKDRVQWPLIHWLKLSGIPSCALDEDEKSRRSGQPRSKLLL